jgi:outer membrane protein W
VRAGYSLPLGDVLGSGTTMVGGTTITQTGESLSDAFNGRLPLILDAGYRINPNIYVGAMLMYGVMFINSSGNSTCGQPGSNCSAYEIEFGVDAHYHFLPDATFDPWAGIGLGYEWMNTSATVMGRSIGGQYSGFQFVNIQAGGDYKVMPNLGIGPFVMFSLGQYSSVSGSSGALTLSEDIQNKGLHEWLTLGIRGAYDINL